MLPLKFARLAAIWRSSRERHGKHSYLTDSYIFFCFSHHFHFVTNSVDWRPSSRAQNAWFDLITLIGKILFNIPHFFKRHLSCSVGKAKETLENLLWPADYIRHNALSPNKRVQQGESQFFFPISLTTCWIKLATIIFVFVVFHRFVFFSTNFNWILFRP